MKTISAWSLLFASTIFLPACKKDPSHRSKRSGKNFNEAPCVGRTAESLKAAGVILNGK